MDNQATGLFIKQLRTEKNLTQKELADRLHVTDKAVSKWERGLSLPAVDLLQPLSQALGISVVELLDAQRHQDNSIDLQKANAILEDTTRRLKKPSGENASPSSSSSFSSSSPPESAAGSSGIKASFSTKAPLASRTSTTPPGTTPSPGSASPSSSSSSGSRSLPPCAKNKRLKKVPADPALFSSKAHRNARSDWSVQSAHPCPANAPG